MPITDLTGTKWRFNDTLNITSNNTWNVDGGLIAQYPDEGINTFELVYDTSDGVFTSFSIPAIYQEAWTSEEGWANEDFKSIFITGGADSTNATLISWLEANATQIQDESNPFSFGNLPIANMFFGSQQVKKVYLGNTVLWEKEEEKPLLAPTISLYDDNTALKIESANDEESQYEIYVDGVLVKTYKKFYDFEADSNTLTKCIGRQYYTGEIVTPQTVNGTPITSVGQVSSVVFDGTVASKITISEGVTEASAHLFDSDTATVNVVFPSTITSLQALEYYPQTTVNIGLPGYIEYGWTTALPTPNSNMLCAFMLNVVTINIYIKSTIVTLNDYCLLVSFLAPSTTVTVNLYFDESENETMTIGTNLLYTGTQKHKMTYNVYADNASIKDALLTYAGNYCTVNAYKRNGGAWE